MKRVDTEAFYEDVYSVVAEIPPGKVMTYGDIAALIGWPDHSRLVGRAMRDVPSESDLPCHRVISASGKLSPCFDRQGELLEREGVHLRGNGTVSLRKYRWRIPEP